MNNAPKISIGMPVFNGELYIADAIESVLNQTFSDLELIISDNASSDTTQEICEAYAKKDNRIRYIRQSKNVGAAGNFNYTFEVAKGEYFAWLAHDDLIKEKYLEACLKVLEHNDSVVLCFSKTKFIDEHGEFICDYEYSAEVQDDDTTKRFVEMISASHIVVEVFGLIRSDILAKSKKIASFMTSDFVLLSELLLYGKFYELPDYLFYHREHKDRSVKACADPKDREKWFDTSKDVKFVFPWWRRLFEHAKVVIRTPLSMKLKIKLLGAVLKVVYWRKSVLLDDVLNALRTQRAS